jgi:hypothetical protein
MIVVFSPGSSRRFSGRFPSIGFQFIGFFGINGLRFVTILFDVGLFTHGRGDDIGVVGLSCGFVFGANGSIGVVFAAIG